MIFACENEDTAALPIEEVSDCSNSQDRISAEVLESKLESDGYIIFTPWSGVKPRAVFFNLVLLPERKVIIDWLGYGANRFRGTFEVTSSNKLLISPDWDSDYFFLFPVLILSLEENELVLKREDEELTWSYDYPFHERYCDGFWVLREDLGENWIRTLFAVESESKAEQVVTPKSDRAGG